MPVRSARLGAELDGICDDATEAAPVNAGYASPSSSAAACALARDAP
jgi:hypothetical protein